jgi:hypothetical protein
MTYIFNMIRIPNHGVDLWHHGLGFGERNPNYQWSCRKVEREKRRKERMKKEKERVCPILCRSHADLYGATDA